MSASTDEERRLVEDEKARFLNDVEVDEDSLWSWSLSLLAFNVRITLASDEERLLVKAEKVRFLKAVEDYKKALDEYNRESQNSVPPAA